MLFPFGIVSNLTQLTNRENEKTTYPDGNAVTNTYDTLGCVANLMDYDGKGTTYTCDAEGKVTKAAYSDGSTTEYDYNAAGLMIQQKEVDKANSTRREIIYGYDDAGNLKSEQRTGVDVKKADQSVRYYYDKANNLTSTVIEGMTTTYSYDISGNLLPITNILIPMTNKTACSPKREQTGRPHTTTTLPGI